MKKIIGLTVPLVLLAGGCGPTIGDPCTVASECGDQLCLNQSYTPGGYCSKRCTSGDDTTCPSGSTCVARGDGPNPACFRVCGTIKDCRNGYTCMQSGGSSKPICIAASGF